MSLILIAHGEPATATLIRNVLEEEGFQTIFTTDGLEALRWLRGARPGLAVVDLLMQTRDGRGVLELIETESDIPVLVLTELSKEAHARAVAARVRALLQRAGPAENPSPVLRSGQIEMNTSTQEVLDDGVPVDLTPTEFRILQALMEHPNQVCTRETLLERMHSGRDREILVRTVDVHIAKLRKKLRTTGLDRIVSIRGIGYKLRDTGQRLYRGSQS